MSIRFARISNSPRLQIVHELLSDGGEHSTLEICIRCEVCAVSSIITELRAQGAVIPPSRQVRSPDTGARSWLYRMTKPIPAAVIAGLKEVA